MTSIIGTAVKPKHPLTESLISFVSTPIGWRVYMGVHCRLRQVIYDHIYLYEGFDKQYFTKEVLKSYIPILEREYIKWQKGEGRTVSTSAFSDDVKQETAEVVLAWLLAECAEIYRQSRLNIKYSKKKKINNWL
jgi:hypothetical protein